MSDVWIKIIENAPDLGVLTFIVWMFLKHLKGFSLLIRDLNRENTEARSHSREVIEKNTEAMGKNTEAMREM